MAEVRTVAFVEAKLDVAAASAETQPASPPRRTVALLDPTPTYRKGLAVALEEAGFLPVEPADLEEWVSSGSTSLILVTINQDEDWNAIPSAAFAAGAPIVVLLPSPTPEAYAAVFRRGATGAAPWSADPEHIVRVLDGAADGLAVVPFEVTRALATEGCAPAPPDWVTSGTVDCLQKLAEGLTVVALAQRSRCSERAMYRRLQCIYGRMGVNNRSEAIALASRWGLIS